MTNRKQSLGRWGEEHAAAYLEQHDYHVVARNVRTAYGELDLVAQQGETLVFVEVKTRTSDSYGLPEEAVTPLKAAHILASAQAYLQEHGDENTAWRVDVVAIRKMPGADVEVVVFEDAVH